MKDKILSAIRIILGFVMLFYVYYIYTNNLLIVKEQFVNINLLVVGLVGLLGLGILIMGIRFCYFPRLRLIQFFGGVCLILFANYILNDNPSRMIYVADMMNVLGAWFMIAGPTGVCIPNKVKKQKAEEKIEIIEV